MNTKNDICRLEGLEEKEDEDNDEMKVCLEKNEEEYI